MKYFARIDGRQAGPLSLTELVEAGVRPSTYVWAKNMSDWQRAGDVPEVCRAMRRYLSGFDPETGELVTKDAGADGASAKQAEAGSYPAPGMMGLRGIGESGRTPDYSEPPQGVSVIMAVLATILCFPLTGLVAIWYALKTRTDWNRSLEEHLKRDKAEALRRKAHEDARIYRIMIGITFSLGLMMIGLMMMVR